MPSNSPAVHTRMPDTPKNQSARLVAGHRLSARQPIVFGVSRRARKLRATQAAMAAQVQGWFACSFQMYQATNPENASPSIRQDHRSALQLTRIAPMPYSGALGAPRSIPGDSRTIF